MEHFPEAIRKITRIRPLRVTALGFADSCLLRAVVPSSDAGGERILSRGPAAELGTIAHDVLAEISAGNSFEADVSNAVDSLLEKHLRQAEERLSKEPLNRRYADLRSTKTSLEWERYKAGLIRSAGLVEVQPSRAGRRFEGSSQVKARNAAKSGVERSVTSNELDITGRIDRIARGKNGEIEIIDYKTKMRLDASGGVPKEVRTQLELYALIMSRYEEIPNIRLRVSVIGGGEFAVPLADNWELERQEWLMRIIGRVPRHVELEAEELAVPSPSCVGCHIRHRCKSYLEAAPSAWIQNNLSTPWPLDIWGEVIKVEPTQGEQLNVLVRDAAGRLVRLTGLLFKFIDQPINSGEMLSFFSLHAGIPPQTSTARPHPTNFFEQSPTRGGKKAYSLAIFNGVNSSTTGEYSR